MIPPFIDDRADAGAWDFILTYHCPRSLRVETFQHLEDTAQHSPKCDSFHAGPVNLSNHDNEVHGA